MPRTFRFNREVALDVFYVHFDGQPLGVLNCVCHGSSLHVRALMDHSATSEAVRRAVLGSLLRAARLGHDRWGGQEFGGLFARGAEQLGRDAPRL